MTHMSESDTEARDSRSRSMQLEDELQYVIPVVGYEVLEERKRFTIFKIQIIHPFSNKKWFVYRRFADFIRLNKKLQIEFPNLLLDLPPKKWFGNNFDPVFLEDRQAGLQFYINNLIANSEVKESKEVKAFFCLDSPPSDSQSLEQSKMFCQSLEQSLASMRQLLKEKDEQINLLKAKSNVLINQQDSLLKALRLECQSNRRNGEEDEAVGVTYHLNLSLLDLCEKTLSQCQQDLNMENHQMWTSKSNGFHKQLAESSSCVLSRSQSEICLNVRPPENCQDPLKD